MAVCCDCPQCSEVKRARSIGRIAISNDGWIEPVALMDALSPAERVILVRLAFASPHPVTGHQLRQYQESSAESMKSHMTRIRPKLTPYGLHIVSVHPLGWSLRERP